MSIANTYMKVIVNAAQENAKMSNYPEGSMMGSGIYSEDIIVTFICEYCGEDNDDVDASTDDWQYNAYADCEHCQMENEISLLDEAADAAADSYIDYIKEQGLHE